MAPKNPTHYPFHVWITHLNSDLRREGNFKTIRIFTRPNNFPTISTNYEILRLYMTKKEIVFQISEKTGMESKDIVLALDTMFKVVQDGLAKGQNIYLRGFASLIVKKRKAKKGRTKFRNGAKGEQIQIPEKFTPKFIPCKKTVNRVAKLPINKL